MSKRKSVSLHDKSLAIESILSGKSRKEVSTSLGVSLSTIALWVKDKDIIFENTNKVLNFPCAKRVKPSPYNDIEKILFTWINQLRNDGKKINGAEIRSEAVRLSIELGVVGFCGSEGWLGRFRRRYGVRGFSSNSSQSSSSHQRRPRHPHPRLGAASLHRGRGLHNALRHPQARARRRAALVTRLLDSWRPRDIFAVDATSLYYALRPGQRVASQRKKKRRRSNKTSSSTAAGSSNVNAVNSASLQQNMHRSAGPPQPPNHGTQPHLRLHDDDPEEDPLHRADCLYTTNGHTDMDRTDIGGGGGVTGQNSLFNHQHADDANGQLGQAEEEENTKLTAEEEAKLTVENRLTFVMCANMDASEKLPLLVIGKAESPVSCSQPSPNTYCYNARSRLTDDGFSSWLRAFDRDRRRLGRRAALLVPGDARPFSARRQQRLHRGLTNTTVFTLPSSSSSTSVSSAKRRGKKKKSSDAHPLKSGVVEDFKTRYRIQVLRRCPATLLAPVEPVNQYGLQGGMQMLNIPQTSLSQVNTASHYSGQDSRSPSLHNDPMHAVSGHLNLPHAGNTSSLINTGIPLHGNNNTPSANANNTSSSPINPAMAMPSNSLTLNPSNAGYPNHQAAPPPSMPTVADTSSIIDVMAARECATIAWNSVRKDTVKLAFARCGFAPANTANADNIAADPAEPAEAARGNSGGLTELSLLMDAFNKSTGRVAPTVGVGESPAGGATSCRAYINADDYLSAYSDTEDERDAEERQLEEEEERMFADEAKLDIKLEQFDADLARDGGGGVYASLPIFPGPNQRGGDDESPSIHTDDDPLHRITLMPVGNMGTFPSQSTSHAATLDDLSPDDPLLPIAMLPLESLQDSRSSRVGLSGAGGSREANVSGPYPKQGGVGGGQAIGMHGGVVGGGYSDAMRHLACVRDYFANDSGLGGNAIYDKLDDIKTSIESIRQTRISRPPGD